MTAASRRIDRDARKRSGSATARLARSGSAPPEQRRCLAPRVEAARGGNIHESLFADAREKRRVHLLREAEQNSEIEARSCVLPALAIATAPCPSCSSPRAREPSPCHPTLPCGPRTM